MAITIVDISPKLQNGDADTPASTDMLVSVGMGRSSNTGRTLDNHDADATTYTIQFFEENSPGATNTFSFGSFTRSPPSGSTTEDFTWSGAMVSSGDGDSVRYGLDGTHASTNLGGDAVAFTSTTTPGAITLTPVPNSGDAILYWIAFNTGAISSDPSGFGSPDVTGEMANLSQGRWYSKISDGTETTVAATLTASATGTHVAVVVPAAAGGGPTTTPKSTTYSATGTASLSTVTTFTIQPNITATGTLSLVKLISKFFGMNAIGSSAIQKTTSKSFSITATGTPEQQEGIVVDQATTYTATGTLSTATRFIIGVGGTIKRISRAIVKNIVRSVTQLIGE